MRHASQTIERQVIKLTWCKAKDYIAWSSRRTDRTCRLQTEAEWEYAARGVAVASVAGNGLK
jgi:formylglycine-generating enzyme required for sulfatase activity